MDIKGLSQAVGKVVTLTGTVTAQKADGSTIKLAVGAELFKGDLIITGAGGQIGLTLTDKSRFALGENAKMRVDELTYNPAAKTGNLAVSIMKGVFMFVTGEIAHLRKDEENMKVHTATATVGIRGTQVAGEIKSDGSDTTFTLLPNPDGSQSTVVITNAAGSQIINQNYQSVSTSNFFSPPSAPVAVPPAQVEAVYSQAISVMTHVNSTLGLPPPGTTAPHDKPGATPQPGATKPAPAAPAEATPGSGTSQPSAPKPEPAAQTEKPVTAEIKETASPATDKPASEQVAAPAPPPAVTTPAVKETATVPLVQTSLADITLQQPEKSFSAKAEVNPAPVVPVVAEPVITPQPVVIPVVPVVVPVVVAPTPQPTPEPVIPEPVPVVPQPQPTPTPEPVPVTPAPAPVVTTPASSGGGAVSSGPPTIALAGTVADGYISGAKVYLDLDDDGTADSNEDTGLTTDSNGHFSGTTTLAGDHAFLAVGGVNTDTGLLNTLVLKAPSGSSIINPLTTLVQTYLDANPGSSVAGASSAVKTAFNLGNIDPLTYDPIAENDLAVQKIAAQVASLVILANHEGATTDQVLGNLVASIAAAGGTPLDLSNPDTLTTLFAGTGVSDIPTLVGSIQSANIVIQNATNLDAISTAQLVALNTETPVANADSLVAVEDVSITFTAAQLLGNDTDADSGILRIAGVTSGTGGTAVLNENGSVSFTPTANFSGAATFSYTVSDGELTSAAATATVTVAAVNDVPLAVADSLTAAEDTAVTYSAEQLLGNDTDVENATLSIASVTSGTGGTAVLNSNGSVTFTPNANYNGTADFIYTVSDGGQTANAAATIAIAAVNDAPLAAADSLTATEDTAVTYSAEQLLGNDTDVENATLSITSVTSGTGGTAVLDEEYGSIIFTPTANFSGTASFSYTVSDGSLSSSATASVNVATINDTPTLSLSGSGTGEVIDFEDLPSVSSYAPIPDSYRGFNWVSPSDFGYINKDHGTGYYTGTVSGTYASFPYFGYQPSDILLQGNGTFTFKGAWFTSAFSGQSTALTLQGFNNGELLHTASHTISFTQPLWVEPNWSGIDQVRISLGSSGSWWVMDDFTLGGASAPAFTDTAADDIFAAVSGTLTGSDGDTGTTLAYGISGGTVAGSTATLTGSYGTLSVDTSSGAYTFSPNDAAIEALKTTATDSFTVTVSDGIATTTDTLTINLAGANDTTSFGGTTSGSVTEDGTTTATGTLTVSDRDSGDAAITAQSNTAGDYGTFSIGTDGVWSYSLDNLAKEVQALESEQTLTDSFSVATAGGSTQAVTITIHGDTDVNAAPTAVSETFSVVNHGTRSGSLLANDSDPESSTLTVSLLQNAVASQYASSVIAYSSQWATSSWAAHQALGAPNTFSYGDIATAWAPLPLNSAAEYITLGFTTPVYASGATIRETYGNGFVTRIDALDTDDTYHQVWSGADTSQPGSPVDFSASWATTSYLVDGLKIYVDANHNTSAWEEIDAVTLHSPTDSATHLGTLTLETDGDFTYVAGTTAGTDVFHYQVSDGQGGISAASVSFEVSANVAPTLAAVPSASTFTDTSGNDTFSNATGTLAASDSDDTTLTYGISGNQTGSYGTLSVDTSSGAYTFTPDDAAIEALKTNATDSFTVTASDGIATTTNTLTINLTGANDTASIGGTASGSVTEDGTTIAQGTLTVSDRDSGDAVFKELRGDATHGSYSIDSDGAWTYTLNNVGATVQALDASQTLSDSFAAETADGTTQSISITINGADEPTATETVGSSGLAGISINGVVADSLEVEGSATMITGMQYAIDADSGSDSGSGGYWAAQKAVGAPDTFDYGDISTAWAPRTKNSGDATLVLDYSTPVYATGATVRETYGNGFVFRIDAREAETTDGWHTVWSGTDTSLPGNPVDFTVVWAPTSYLVDGLKVHVNTEHNARTWEEIDAVTLYGSNGGSVTEPTTAITANSLMGDGGNNVIVINQSNLTAGTVIDGGGGFDTLQLDGSGIVLDFDALVDDKIEDIERVDLTGDGNNSLSVSLDSVLELNENSILLVDRNADDTVTVSGSGWTTNDSTPVTLDGTSYTPNAGVVTYEGVTYSASMNAAADLLIDQAVQAPAT